MPKAFECTSGSFTGTGAAKTVTLGFKPDLVILFNETDGDTLVMHIDGMTDATSLAIVGSVASCATGVTLTATGFTLGISAVANENGKTYKYVAIGGN